ncbi:MAG: HlyD family secretion protein [Pseudolabrys sp.]|nr:HlyD family secretion protein [Pseudolabrys sp.]
MSENTLRVVAKPEAKIRSEREAENKAHEGAAPPLRRRLRLTLLIVLPALAGLIGLGVYLSGGRYVSTDNAYVGAQKILITPDISGKIVHVAVVEGQHVRPGDELFTLDPEPYRLALEGAEAKLAAAKADYDKLKATLKSVTELAQLAEKNVELKQRDVDRKTQLLKTQAGSQADVDTAVAALVTAQLQAQFAEQQRATTLSQLLGNPDLPLDRFPEYAQAIAALQDAQRNLRLTIVRAPISGTATQVDNIELGRYIAAGTPVLSIIDDEHPWVDANPKETDITYLRVGQKATISVDSFPDRVFKGTVVAVSPGTGAQFSILPPQNATGNWVKVVQRVPVRIAFDDGQDTRLLRAGMSVVVDIYTGHCRLPALLCSPGEK